MFAYVPSLPTDLSAQQSLKAAVAHVQGCSGLALDLGRGSGGGVLQHEIGAPCVGHVLKMRCDLYLSAQLCGSGHVCTICGAPSGTRTEFLCQTLGASA